MTAAFPITYDIAKIVEKEKHVASGAFDPTPPRPSF
jgi:hypothetical protein